MCMFIQVRKLTIGGFMDLLCSPSEQQTTMVLTTATDAFSAGPRPVVVTINVPNCTSEPAAVCKPPLPMNLSVVL